MAVNFNLDHDPDPIPLFRNQHDALEAARVSDLRWRFKLMLEWPYEYRRSPFVMANREHLIHAIEQVNPEDVASFILFTIDMLEGETQHAQQYIDDLEARLAEAEDKLKGVQS